MYQDMFNIGWASRRDTTGNWDMLDVYRWQEKLALRRRMVAAFHHLDKKPIERADSDNTG
jgi:hypothetical protein